VNQPQTKQNNINSLSLALYAFVLINVDVVVL
jgi:hypothetical protein